MQLRVSFTEGAGFVLAWPALCARAYGHYAREGLDVDLIVRSEREQTDGLVSGEIPIARRGPDPQLRAIDAGAAVRTIAGLVCKPPVHLFAQPGIRSVAELRGRTLAGKPGLSASAMLLLLVLADAGLGAADCSYRDVGRAENRFEALRSGEVAAGLLSPPASARAEAEGFALLCRLPAAYPRLTYSVLQIDQRFGAAQRAAVVALLRAELRAVRWLVDPANKVPAVQELTRAAGMSAADAAAAYVEMIERDAVYCTDLAIDAGRMATLIDALDRYAGMPAASAPEAYLDLSYLEEARTEGK